MHSDHEKFGYICSGFAPFSIVLGLFGSRWRPVQNIGCISVCKPCWHKKSLQENGTELVSKSAFSFNDLRFDTEDLLTHIDCFKGRKIWFCSGCFQVFIPFRPWNKKYCTKRHMFVVLCFLARSSDVVVFLFSAGIQTRTVILKPKKNLSKSMKLTRFVIKKPTSFSFLTYINNKGV